MTAAGEPAATVLLVLMSVVGVSMILAAIRLLSGPSLADRVMALDVLIAAGVASVALLAWRTGQMIYLDLAVAVAMVTFLSAVALAWYLDKRGDP